MAAGADGAHGPMHQFEITRLFKLDLFGLDASFTNSSLFMVIALVAVSVFLIYSMQGRSLVPSRTQSVAEMLYEFIAKCNESLALCNEVCFAVELEHYTEVA